VEALRIEKAGKLVFQVTGNTGGVANPIPQQLVAEEMAKAVASRCGNEAPAFLYLLGNIVYYNGQSSEYRAQFYEPYAHYPAPIFAIPGNHDGDTRTDEGAVPTTEPSLFGYMRNFCSPTPQLPEFGGIARTTMNEPNSFWTLTTPLATIIGLYTNVPQGGTFDENQRQWLATELQNAPIDRALILAMHHSPYAFSRRAVGSPYLVRELQNAINKAHRVPNMVLSATANLYERIEVTVASDVNLPFFIIGTGGYRNLYQAGRDVKPGNWDEDHQAQLKEVVDNRHGFVTLELTQSTIEGRFTAVERPKDAAKPIVEMADSFTYSARAIILRPDQKLEWLPPNTEDAVPR